MPNHCDYTVCVTFFLHVSMEQYKRRDQSCVSAYILWASKAQGFVAGWNTLTIPFSFLWKWNPSHGEENVIHAFFKIWDAAGTCIQTGNATGFPDKTWMMIHTLSALWPRVYLWAPDTNRGRRLSDKRSSSLEKAAVTVCGFVRLFVTAEGVQLSGAEALSCSLLTQPCSFKHEYSLLCCSTEQGGEGKRQIQGIILNHV